MAIIQCRKCKSKLSGNAKSCLVCGAPLKRRTSLVTWVVTFIVVAWLGGSLVSGLEEYDDNKGSKTVKASPNSAGSENTQPEKILDAQVHTGSVKSEPFARRYICKAGISKIMGRDPTTMSSRPTSDETIKVSYLRADDRKKFSYKCKIEGNRIVWGNSDGRWRTDPSDPVVTYKVKGNVFSINESFNDGSTSNENFSLIQLRQEKDKEAQIRSLVDEAKKIPVSEYEKNLYIYKWLGELSPESEEFKKKVKFYKEKLAAQKEKARQEMLINLAKGTPATIRFCKDLAQASKYITNGRDAYLHRQVVEDVFYKKNMNYEIRKRYLEVVAKAYDNPRNDIDTVMRDVYVNCLSVGAPLDLRGWEPIYTK